MNSASGYEKAAAQFLDARNRSSIGSKVVRQWATRLPDSAEVLEIACGGGYPVTRELINAKLKVWAIDSSPSLLAEFRDRFPEVSACCELLQESDFFNRQFSAVIAVGILFLLPEKEQIDLLRRVAEVLESNGKFLFTAPTETGSWQDSNTGLTCISLGVERYTSELSSLGFENIESFMDSGDNHYYACEIVNKMAAQ